MGHRADQSLAALGLHAQDVPAHSHRSQRLIASLAVTATLAVIAAVGGLYLWHSFAPHSFDTVRHDAISRSNRTPVTLQPRSFSIATTAQVQAWGAQDPVDLRGRQYLVRVHVEVKPHSGLSPYALIQDWSLSGPRHPVSAVEPNLDDALPAVGNCVVTGQALEASLDADGDADFCLLFSVPDTFDRNQLVYGGFVQHLSGRHGGYSAYNARWRLPAQ